MANNKTKSDTTIGPLLIYHSGEMGLLVTKIDDVFTFEGYKASKATNDKKIVRDVVKKGDKFFNTGDLMMIDKEGYVYFCDRLGDTFR